MSDQLSHKLKLDRASHHLNSLDAKVRDWRDGETHDYAVELDRESGKQRVKVKLSESPPDEFRLIIGDYLHNLRSALDNLGGLLWPRNSAFALFCRLAESQFEVSSDFLDSLSMKLSEKSQTSLRPGRTCSLAPRASPVQPSILVSTEV